MTRLASNMLLVTLSFALSGGCAHHDSAETEGRRREVDAFLDTYTAQYLALTTEASEAEWAVNTKIVDGDTTNAKRANAANGAVATFQGAPENIAAARRFKEWQQELTPTQVRQLDTVLYLAAGSPGTLPAVVKQRIAAETAQTESLFGYQFKLDGRPVSTGDLDEMLRASSDLDERRRVWESSKEVGRGLKNGLAGLRDLRNKIVRSVGYDSYFDYQVKNYGLTVKQMMELLDDLQRQLRPLYRELHTWARYELAKNYGRPVPDQIPAHWLPNRWAQDWSPLVKVDGIDLDAMLASKNATWLVRQGEDFYESIGLGQLPLTFYSKSSLFPLPAGTPYKKNNHASAWHMDLNRDVRCLMSVEPNRDYWDTVHHELGHIYYYLLYSNDRVPPLLREGANRAYHEALGTMLGLAAMQPDFIKGRGLAPADAKVDSMQYLLKEALNYVVFIPFSCGTMSRFEHDLYEENLSPDEFNERWWAHTLHYQGVVPPGVRGEEFCDAATKTHINNDAAQYYDYALSSVIMFQLHEHIASNILRQDPRNTDYYGRPEVGEFLRGIMEKGADCDWNEVLENATGSGLTAEPMLRYFEPLLGHLRKLNEGRKATLGDL